MWDYIIAILVVPALLIGWLLVQQLGRNFARAHPEFGAAHKNLAIVLFHRGEYHAAAREVDLARKHGAQPHPDFVRALSEKLLATD